MLGEEREKGIRFLYIVSDISALAMGGRLSKSRGSNHYPQYVSTTSRSTSRYSSHPGAHDLPRATGRLQKKYSKIGDDYNSVEQVRYALGSSPCEVKSIHLMSLNYNL